MRGRLTAPMRSPEVENAGCFSRGRLGEQTRSSTSARPLPAGDEKAEARWTSVGGLCLGFDLSGCGGTRYRARGVAGHLAARQHQNTCENRAVEVEPGPPRHEGFEHRRTSAPAGSRPAASSRVAVPPPGKTPSKPCASWSIRRTVRSLERVSSDGSSPRTNRKESTP